MPANPYAKGRNEFTEWIKRHFVHLAKTTDNGLQTHETGWDHFAWTITVTNTRHPGDNDSISYDFDYRQGLGHTKKPTLTDLIASLFSDASCVIDRSFEEFAGELGYDPDSKKAEAMYKQIQVNNGRLLRLFRATDLATLLTASEDMRERAGIL